MKEKTTMPNAFTSSGLLQCDVSGATSPTTRTKGTRGGSEPRDGVLQEIGGVNAMPAARPHTSEMAIRLARDNFGFFVFVSMIYFLTFSRFAQKNTRKKVFRAETLMP